MRLRLLAPVAVVAACAAALPALAVPAAAPRPVDVVRGDLGAAAGDPEAWALAALRRNARALGVDAAAYRVESVRESLVGTHVRARQQRGGVPVRGTDALVSALDGRVVQVDAVGSRLPGAPAAAPVGELVARAAALGRLQVRTLLTPTAVERELVPTAGRLVDTYQVSVVASLPAVASVVSVDAATGRVLAVSDDTRRVEGSAKVFDPNPIQSTRNPSLRQPGVDQMGVDTDLDSPALTAARKVLPLKQLDAAALATGRLSGPWVNVVSAGNLGVTPVFDVTKSDPRFEGLMSYAHVDRFQRYLQGLGFRGAKGVNAEPQEVVALPVQGFDNSFYQPGNDLILMGAGGVDDAEDAEVILHEYGHAVQDAQVPGWGATPEGGAMGEAFGDFQAGNYFARTSGGGVFDVCLMEWDSTSYAKGSPTCIRRMDSTKRYPRDIVGQVHTDGALWSAFLWRVRAGLPGSTVQKSDAAIKLVLTAQELLTPQAEFGDAVAALRTAANALKMKGVAALVDREARRTGFPLR